MEYAAVDIGGSKTLVANLSASGVIGAKMKFPTPPQYDQFLSELAKALQELPVSDFTAAGVAVPGRIDRTHGIGRIFGNLPWRDVPLQHDIEQLLRCPVLLEHDPSLAGLSEAMLIKDISRVLYVTVSTGIGAGLIIDRQIDENFAASEAGQMVVEQNGRHERWESFASGSAIVRRYGKMAKDIDDEPTWQAIARDIAAGMQELLALTGPDVIVIGGSVGRYFDRFGDYLTTELKRFETPLVPVPPIKAAERPDDAVVYGCYDLAAQHYGVAD